MTKTNKGHDYSTLLIWAAAIVTVARYSGAFIASDLGQLQGWLSDLLTIAMGISGFGMGVLDVIGGTYLFDGLRRSMPANGKAWPMRFKILAGMVFMLIISGVLILVPFTMSRVEHVNMDSVLGTSGWLFGWSLLVNLTPYLLIGGVAISTQVVTVNAANNANEQANTGANDSQPENNKSKVYANLSQSEKYLIVNSPSADVAADLGVTQRAIQKWRKKVQEEISQGKL